MTEHHKFKKYGLVHKMDYDSNLFMHALQGSDDSHRTLRSWNDQDQEIEACEVRDFVVRQGEVRTTAVGLPTTFMTILSDGNTAYGLKEGVVRIELSPNTYKDEGGITGHQPTAIARCGSWDVVATTDGKNTTLRLVARPPDMSSMMVMGDVIVSGNKISVLEISPSREVVALNGPDDAVGLWKFIGETSLSMLKHAQTRGTTVTAIKWLGDDYLITGDNRGTLRVWDVRSGKLLSARTDHQQLIYRIENVDDSIFTSSHDGQVRSWALDNFPIKSSLI